VADAPGEVGELTVGARELESQATQLEDLDRLAGEQIERSALLVGEGARLLREDAQRADRDALGRDERARRVEADLRELAGDERIRGEPLVDAGIVDEHVTRVLQDDGAHRILARADVRDDAVRRHLMLMRVVDDVDDGSRDPAQCRGQAREAFEVRLGGFADDPIARDRVDPCAVVDRVRHSTPLRRTRIRASDDVRPEAGGSPAHLGSRHGDRRGDAYLRRAGGGPRSRGVRGPHAASRSASVRDGGLPRHPPAGVLPRVRGRHRVQRRHLGDDEPSRRFVRDATGRQTSWIEVGAPDAERLHHGSKLAGRVRIYTHRDPAKVLPLWAGKKIHRVEDVVLTTFDRGSSTMSRMPGAPQHRDALRDRGQLYLDVNGVSLTSGIHRRSIVERTPVRRREPELQGIACDTPRAAGDG
jgi:hypothetical protein